MKVVTIGRSSGNEVVINDRLVLRNHLHVIQDDCGNYCLADFGSKNNGTFVNDRQVSGEVHLNPNDVIRIGIIGIALLVGGIIYMKNKNNGEWGSKIETPYGNVCTKVQGTR
jgi:pSer/pThr/pTyr-binding forkhead associated (FHA) protein